MHFQMVYDALDRLVGRLTASELIELESDLSAQINARFFGVASKSQNLARQPTLLDPHSNCNSSGHSEDCIA